MQIDFPVAIESDAIIAEQQLTDSKCQIWLTFMLTLVVNRSWAIGFNKSNVNKQLWFIFSQHFDSRFFLRFDSRFCFHLFCEFILSFKSRFFLRLYSHFFGSLCDSIHGSFCDLIHGYLCDLIHNYFFINLRFDSHFFRFIFGFDSRFFL